VAARTPTTNIMSVIDKAETMRNPHDLPVSQLLNCCSPCVNAGFSDYLACALICHCPTDRFLGGGIPALNRLGVERYGVVVAMLTVFMLSYLTPWLISEQ
jgi:hypothetical protein